MASSSQLCDYLHIPEAYIEADLEELRQTRFSIKHRFDKYDSNCTELHVAADNGDLDLVKRLVTEGADINRRTRFGYTPLDYAARSGHLEIAKYLWSQGASPYAGRKRTTLHVAVRYRKSAIVKHLLEVCRVNPNVIDSLGRTPLHEAAKRLDPESLEIVTMLLDHSAHKKH